MTGIFEHDGVRFRYETLGSGRAFAFCHGLTGDRQQPKDLAGELPGHRLIVWDCRGHGETEPLGPEDKLGFGQMAADLAALLDHLGQKRVILGGISMGAGIAARFAVQWPQRVEALVLVRPAWLTQPAPDNLALLPRAAEMLRRLGPAGAAAEFARLPELARLRQTSPAVADSFCEQFTKPGALQRVARLERLPADCPVDKWDLVEVLTIPALVIGTQRDPVHPMEFAQAWAEHLPRANFQEITSKSEDDARHIAEFRRHLARFLNSLEPH